MHCARHYPCMFGLSVCLVGVLERVKGVGCLGALSETDGRLVMFG